MVYFDTIYVRKKSLLFFQCMFSMMCVGQQLRWATTALLDFCVIGVTSNSTHRFVLYYIMAHDS